MIIGGYSVGKSFLWKIYMRLSLNQTMSALAVAAGLAAIEPPASAQYVTDAEQAKQVQDDRIEEEHAFYRELEGKTFWYQPGRSMLARFYPTYKTVSSGEIYLPVGGAFTPANTVSFTIERYIPSMIASSGPATHVYQVKLEDGTVAFMRADDFGTFLRGFSDMRDTHFTDEPGAVEPSTKAHNDKFLTKSPEAILAQEAERKRLKTEADEKERQEQAEQDDARQLKLQQMVAKIEAATAAQKRKGGVRIGMTSRQVLNSSWGKPSDINRTTTAAGVTEQWVYGDSAYLYFTNGKLTAIQN
jgi:hypothetical protein